MRMEKDEKTKIETVDEFLARGGKIEKLPTPKYEEKNLISSTAKTPPDLKTLAEGELLYGEKKKVKKKKKKADYSSINMDLIPDHLKSLIDNSNQNKEESNETNKNS